MKFIVPLSGNYLITSITLKAAPTGKMIEGPNPNRRWYTPWRSKTLLREEYIFETISREVFTVPLEDGDEFYFKPKETLKDGVVVHVKHQRGFYNAASFKW